MIWYVALVAILNIGLGYALAVYMGAGRVRSPLSYPVADSTTDQDQEFDDGDAYYSDDRYDSEETEYESAVAQ
jgi:hypothetical protein